MGLTQTVYHMYQDISEERILTLLDVKTSNDFKKISVWKNFCLRIDFPF